MKKLVLLAFSLCVTFITYAQTTIIPKIGISLANVEGSSDLIGGFDTKSKIGLVLGAAVEFNISDKVSFQPELLFHQKGYSIDESEGSASYTEKNTLNYIELPVLLKLKFSDLYLNVGPSIGFGIGGKYEYEYSEPGFSDNGSGKIKFGEEPSNYSGDDSYVDNAMDFGLQFGIGYKIAGKVLIDVRYGLGLSNLMDKDTANGIDDNKSQNRSFQFTLGYPISSGGN